MTLREKLQIEHPECIDEKWHGGCKDCPHQYGYKKMEECECDSKTVNDEICRKCWDQPYEGKPTMQEVQLLQYYNLRKHFDRVTTEILGSDYYNLAMDVYMCDEITCDSLIRKYKATKHDKHSARLCACVFGIMLVVAIFTLYEAIGG